MGNPTTMKCPLHTILQDTAWTLILIWDLSRTWYFLLYPATNQIYCNYFERSHEPERRVAIYQLRLQVNRLREYLSRTTSGPINPVRPNSHGQSTTSWECWRTKTGSISPFNIRTRENTEVGYLSGINWQPTKRGFTSRINHGNDVQIKRLHHFN